MEEEKKIKKKRKKSYIFLSLLILFQCLLLIGFISYAWFADRSNPSITGSDIQVVAADGLVIKLTPDTAGRTNVNLNTLLSSKDEFELKQISSADGNNFYTIDFGEGLSISKPKFYKVDLKDKSEEELIKYGYIDYDLYLATEDYPKHVYLHKDTSITGPAANSVRIAITMLDDTIGKEVTTIYGNLEENGIDKEYTTEAVISEGEFDFGNIPPEFTTNQLVRNFSYRDGGRGTNDEDEINLNKILATLPANTARKINVKIWLEGGDQYCNNTIASTDLDLTLKFGSANALLQAPILTPLANGTIKGLTTDMEWALTNDKNTIWTPVTDANMNFAGKTIVYVRIAEKVGITPPSYVTEVNFG